jgi:nucleoside-diphosphate-sugar epimerase
VPRSLRHNFLGLNYPSRSITFTDNGEGYFSTTTLDNTALALNRVLLNPSTTANQIVFTSDFATTQKELVQTIERLTGEKWERKSISTEEAIPALKKAWENGEALAGYGLINIGFTKGTYSGHFEPIRHLRNKELGLPEKDLDQVVKEALAEVGHPGFSQYNN